MNRIDHLPPVPPLLKIHLVVLAWAFTAILGKLISIQPVDMVIWRTGLAGAGFLLLSLAMGAPVRVPPKDQLKLFGIGVLLGLHWILFFVSARLSTASISLAALPTLMIWCSLLEPLVNGSRRWSRIELIVGMVTIGAVWLIYSVELRYWLGFSVGLVSALLAALFSVSNKQLVNRFHFATLCTYQMAGACAVSCCLLPFASGRILPELPGAIDFGWLLILSLGCTVLPYAGFVSALRQMSIFTINVVYNLEPLYGIVIAALVFGATEKMTSSFYTGAAVIILSVLLVPWLGKKPKAADIVAT
jgi:drug/metabolite transporter (DMT)-like permease